MTDTVILNGPLFCHLVKGGAANLYLNRSEINDLNVFPIPDGDTGDNMYMTIRSGSTATDGEGTLSEVASEMAHGMLLGARGNSGVILSRIFSGISEGFEGRDVADADSMIRALRLGVEKAYGAVSVPVEGTILTVCREATEAAVRAVGKGATVMEGLKIAREEAARSLERTPELLAPLKEAGVVDSGGAGLLSIIDGMINTLSGRAPEDIMSDPAAHANAPDFSLFTEDSVLEYGYCTEFLLRLQTCKVADIGAFDMDAFTARVCELGDSVVAFRDGSVVKVHVHTKTPSEVLAFGQKYGEFLTVKIENMTLQHSGVEEKKTVRKAHKKYAVVTVAAGEGIRETFLSVGADAVINGGQCMNPSAADFIAEFEKLDADTIFVFPGNSNIILTAEQARDLYDKADVRVIPCRSICETYAALSVLDTSSGDTDAIVEDVTAALSEVVSASVSRANRDADMNGVRVRAGDYIGCCGGKIMTDDADCEEAVMKLADRLSVSDYGVMLLICGADTDAEKTRELYCRLEEKYRQTEIIMMDGGQPIYDYYIMLE